MVFFFFIEPGDIAIAQATTKQQPSMEKAYMLGYHTCH